MKKKATPKKKRAYVKPRMRTENLTVVAAVCNGSGGGGRKATTGAPDFCTSNSLKS